VRTSILFVVNNGYTALNHSALVELVVRRCRNDSNAIDGVVVAGCYFHSDAFEGFALWPIDYVPIHLDRQFAEFDALRSAWNDYANHFMSQSIRGDLGDRLVRGAVIDLQFEVDGVTYVKPAPPIGGQSKFFVNGRPRINSSGIESCPPVALIFPEMSARCWQRIRDAVPDPRLQASFRDWQAQRSAAREAGTLLQPYVGVPVDSEGWYQWLGNQARSFDALQEYASCLFEERIRALLASVRSRENTSIRPSRYIWSVTEVIGQDRANDISHVFEVTEGADDSQSRIQELAVNLRIFREHATALACVHALTNNVDCVLWTENLQYAWR
jgi:hypothetical protein